MEKEDQIKKIISEYEVALDYIEKIINNCNLKDYSKNDLNSFILLLELMEDNNIEYKNRDVSFEKKFLELLEYENYTILREQDQLKNSILTLTNGITNISENQKLPILLNVLMDGIAAYNKMLKKQSESTDSFLDLSFWSIELMDTIYATNGKNNTLLDYTLEKIQDQYPSILSAFDEINYIEGISSSCKISEIYRGIIRLDFGLNERIKSLEKCKFFESKNFYEYQYDEIRIKIDHLREISDFLKNEFISLIKDIIYFSIYLGIEILQYEDEDETSEIDGICEIFKKGSIPEARERMNEFISNLEIEKYEEVLKAFDLLNWLKSRVNICLGKNLREGNKITSIINNQVESADIKRDERLLDHQNTCYYDEVIE